MISCALEDTATCTLAEIDGKDFPEETLERRRALGEKPHLLNRNSSQTEKKFAASVDSVMNWSEKADSFTSKLCK